jgi:FtsH-binding integral membrane protein
MNSEFIEYYYGWMTSNLAVALVAAVIAWRLYRSLASGASSPQTFAHLLVIVATTVAALIGVTFVTAIFNAPPVIAAVVTGLTGGICAAAILRGA